MEGSQEWLEEYWRAEEEGKMALLLRRSIAGGAVMSLIWITGSRGNIEATMGG